MVASAFLAALARGDGAGACSLLNPDDIGNFGGGMSRNCAADLSSPDRRSRARAGRASASSVIPRRASASCDDEDPNDDFVSLELQGPTDDGRLSIGLADGTWLIEDLSNSIWSQASAS